VSKLFQVLFVAFITCALLRPPRPDITLEMLATDQQLKPKNIERPVPVVKIEIVKVTEKVADTNSVAMEFENDCPTASQEG
jgi:hypothetical protein